MIKNYATGYVNTQYEDIALKFDSITCVEAKYINNLSILDESNDLIDALPPIKTDAQSMEFFEYLPYYTPDEKNLSNAERALAILRLDNLRKPRNFTIQLDLAIALALRRCYMARRKFNIREQQNLLEIGSYYRDCEYRRITGRKVMGFSLIGASGAGKSTSIISALQYYPQVIIHETNNSRCIQVVYLVVECPADGSIKAFYDACFTSLADALGIDIDGLGTARTIDSKAMLFKKLALRYNIGMLVIEEIQNLSIRREDTMNQFLTLTNETQIPIVFVGTYKVYNRVFDIDFRLGRRAGEQIEVGRYKYDALWKNLIETLWRYQWCKQVSNLTEETSRIFYEETGGILDRVINLYQMVQLEAINSGIEKITDKLIIATSKKYYQSTRKMLSERSRLSTLIKYEDLYYSTKEMKIKDTLINSVSQKNAIDLITDKERNKSVNSKNNKKSNIISNIQKLFGSKYTVKQLSNVIDKEANKIPDLLLMEENELNLYFIKLIIELENRNKASIDKKESEYKLKILEGPDLYE